MYLGTIAFSEGIKKLNVYLEVDGFSESSKEPKEPFVQIDLSVIDYEEELFKQNNPTIGNDQNSRSQDDKNYKTKFSKYAFLKQGKYFKEYRKKLSSKEYFSVYITAGVASALVYGSLFPQNYLVGASAAISSLLAIAFVIDIKKTLVAVAAAALIISIISPQVQAYTLIKYNELQNQQSQLQNKIQETNQQIAIAQEQNNTQQEQKLNKTKVEQVSKFNQTSSKALTVDEGIKREKHAQTSALVHLTGAFIGLAYLFLFRRELIWQLPSQILPQDWLHRNLKKK